jgi:hypothetical protein
VDLVGSPREAAHVDDCSERSELVDIEWRGHDGYSSKIVIVSIKNIHWNN